MLVAPASRLFSTSSLTADGRSRITWPAQILWTEPLFMGRMIGESEGIFASIEIGNPSLRNSHYRDGLARVFRGFE